MTAIHDRTPTGGIPAPGISPPPVYAAAGFCTGNGVAGVTHVGAIALVKSHIVGSADFPARLTAACADAVGADAVEELLMGVLATMATVRDCTACAARAAVVLTMQTLDAESI